MVDVALIVAVIVFLLVAVIAYKILKGVVKAVILAGAILSIVLAISAFFIISDANDLRENFQKEPSLFLIVDGNTVLSSFRISGGELSVVDAQQQETHSEYLEKKDYGSIKEDNYKLIIMDIASVGGLENGLLEIENQELSAEDLQARISQENLDAETIVGTAMFENIFSDPIVLIKEYKKGNIIVHEETSVFKAIKLIPLSFIKSAAGRIASSAKSAVGNEIEE